MEVGKLICEIEKTPGKLQEKNATAGASTVTVKADSGFYGLSKVNIDAIKLQEKSVNVQNEAQDVVADEGYTALSRVSVAGYPTQEKAVTLAGDASIEPDPGFKAMTKVDIKVNVGTLYSDFANFMQYGGTQKTFETEDTVCPVLNLAFWGNADSTLDHPRILDIVNVTNNNDLTFSNGFGSYISTSMQKLRAGKMPAGGSYPDTLPFQLKEIYCKSSKDINFYGYDYGNQWVSAFNAFKKLVKIVIDSSTFVKCTGIEGLLKIPAFTNGTGKIYVADNLVDTYKAATNWITVADYIRPISEYEAEGGWNYDFYEESE